MHSLKTGVVVLIAVSVPWLMVLPAVSGQVLIGQPEIGPIFAAQYRYYQSQSAGRLSLENHTDTDLFADVSVTVAEYAPRTLVTTVPLPANETTQVPLRIDFDFDKLPTWGKVLMLEGQVEVNVYSEDEQHLQCQLPIPFKLHNLHAIPDESPQAIVVFIDTSDPARADFAQFATQSASDNLQTAQRLFELFKQAQIICVNQVSQTIQYPRELLRTKIGSSYDCALLYAALLENLDIPVALVRADGYILILLEQQDEPVTAERPELVSWEAAPWIPVDIREATFSRANVAGKRAYQTLEHQGKAVPFRVRLAQQQYPPVKFVSPKAMKDIQLGLISAQRGDFVKAESIFKNHLNGEASAAAYNNLGNIYFLNNRYEEAISHYLKAQEIDVGDGAIYLNLGIAYNASGEREQAEAMFDRAYSELGSYQQMCYALGLKQDDSGHPKVRSLLLETEKRALQHRSRPLGTRANQARSEQLPLYWKRR